MQNNGDNTKIFQLKSDNSDLYHFQSGQYVFIKNPKFVEPEETHPFSIASSPLQEDLEFCIKRYGDWTTNIQKLNIGDSLFISEPQGNFIWNDAVTHAVFLLGGIGISPIMSMIRFIAQKKIQPRSLIILYGNRNPESVVYRKELDELKNLIPNLTIIDIYSDLNNDSSWMGYHGFITKVIVEKEVNLNLNSTFYYIGPPIFIEKMDRLLDELHISPAKRCKEDFSLVNNEK